MNQNRNTQHANSSHDPTDMIAAAVMELVWQIIRAGFVAAWWALLFPMVSIPLGVAVAVGVWVSWVLGVVVVGVFIAGMVLWRLRSPQTFERWITSRARARFLTWWRYRRCWAKYLGSCKLTVVREDSTLVPRLVTAQIGTALDRVRVRMLEGQCPADYESRVDRIAHTFGAHECRATIVGPGLVELVLRRADSLADTITLPRLDGYRKDAA
ncbi:hypothetical protein [Nocardia terpenica]|uniref:Uncharacterized protein n=1 Tax=Nocardia terpenica TaxID=455432 RepID=A0A164ME50_9NOCA|nr:hypothetical protein [Nocardia terpenica]KZM73277.1 hypothetical protein AWN90_31940 [Nocardia terpenica]NQE87577.1 hypothetical protein [Nocardia terpenica]